MNLINPDVEAYAEKYTSKEDQLLAEINQNTLQHHPKSHMLSGHVQGRVLEMISQMIQPSRILEIGTFTGYSALCLAKGLKPDGVLHTIESREGEATMAQGYFSRSRYNRQIKLHLGDATKIIGELDENWDLVFIDADKENYINYFNLVLPKLTQNGFILADNTLFHGQVLEEKISGKSAIAIQAFNDFILSRNDLQHVLLTVRDGLMLIRKSAVDPT